MTVPWLLTLLALGGVIAGIFLGQARTLSAHLAAAGGGLLFGISLFWLLPEIAETVGRTTAAATALSVTAGLAVLDRALIHSGHSPRHGVVAPLLVATAIHSFLDGWSVRALSVGPLANVGVPIGLALHKLPEGIAIGWLTRRSMYSNSGHSNGGHSKWKAAAAAGAAELFTLLGAYVEPSANASGLARFGEWWSTAVTAIIAGGFLFFGFHAVLPYWKKAGVVVVFLAMLALVGTVSFFRLFSV